MALSRVKVGLVNNRFLARGTGTVGVRKPKPNNGRLGGQYAKNVRALIQSVSDPQAEVCHHTKTQETGRQPFWLKLYGFTTLVYRTVRNPWPHTFKRHTRHTFEAERSLPSGQRSAFTRLNSAMRCVWRQAGGGAKDGVGGVASSQGVAS